MTKHTAWEKAQFVGIAARMLARGPGEANIGDLEAKWDKVERKAARREKEAQK